MFAAVFPRSYGRSFKVLIPAHAAALNANTARFIRAVHSRRSCFRARDGYRSLRLLLRDARWRLDKTRCNIQHIRFGSARRYDFTTRTVGRAHLTYRPQHRKDKSPGRGYVRDGISRSARDTTRTGPLCFRDVRSHTPLGPRQVARPPATTRYRGSRSRGVIRKVPAGTSAVRPNA